MLRSQLDRLADAAMHDLRPRLDMASIRLDKGMDQALTRQRAAVHALGLRLKACDPKAPLQKGYALVTGPDGVVTNASAAPLHMTLHFSDGQIAVRREEEQHGNR